MISIFYDDKGEKLVLLMIMESDIIHVGVTKNQYYFWSNDSSYVITVTLEEALYNHLGNADNAIAGIFEYVSFPSLLCTGKFS